MVYADSLDMERGQNPYGIRMAPKIVGIESLTGGAAIALASGSESR
jgi:hypothetical protein